MPGERNLKFKVACNQSEDSFQKFMETLGKTPAGARSAASTKIRGSVDLSEDDRKNFDATVGALKSIFEGKTGLDIDIIQTITGDAIFEVRTECEWDRAGEKKTETE